MRFSTSLLVGLMGLAAPSLARADGPVAAGIQLFHQGEFEECVRVLSDVAPSAPDALDRAQAFLFVGLAQAVLGAWEPARASFAAALREDPEIAPDRLRISPAIASAFDEVRATVLTALVVRAKALSSVYLDGKHLGTTPYRGAVPVGRHALQVLSDDRRLEFVKEELVLRATETATVDAILSPRKGQIDLSTRPSGADVLIEDRVVARTPAIGLSVPSGLVRVQVRLSGYQDAEVALEVPPGGAIKSEVVLHLPNDPSEYEHEPIAVWGPDLREGVDRWTVGGGLGVGGTVPTGTRLEVSGGADFSFQFGVAFADFVELSTGFGILTFGPELSYFQGALSPPGGQLGFSQDPGNGGLLHLRTLRLGGELRVTAARIGKFRPFVGVGAYALVPTGKIEYYGLMTSADLRDGYAVTSELSGTSVAPLIGLKYTLFEKVRKDAYWAVDVVMQSRVEVTQWKRRLLASAESQSGLDRALVTAQAWANNLTQEMESVQVSFDVALAARF